MDSLLNVFLTPLQPAEPRSPEETRASCQRIHSLAATPRSGRQRGAIRTCEGIKDTLLEGLLVSVDSAAKNYLSGRVNNRNGLQAVVTTASNRLPKGNLSLSPAFLISSLDVHRDTPVEILHVILLGPAKYFWRDIIRKLDATGKSRLAARIDMLNVTGLNPELSRLSGRTLVTYSGSLVGRDFRRIIQIAPFVLYDLVPSSTLDAWIALGLLARLVWQPVIENLQIYLVNYVFRTVSTWY